MYSESALAEVQFGVSIGGRAPVFPGKMKPWNICELFSLNVSPYNRIVSTKKKKNTLT